MMLAGQTPEYDFVRWVIFDALKLLSPEQHVSGMKKVFSTSNSIRTMANLLALIERAKEEDAAKFTAFSPDDIKELKNVVVDRIRCASQSPALIEHESLPMLLAVWRDWGGSAAEPQTFVDESIKNDTGLLSFVNNFIYQRYSSSGLIVEKTRNRLRVKPLSDWTDLKLLLSRLDNTKPAHGDDKGGQVLEIARSELKTFGGLWS